MKSAHCLFDSDVVSLPAVGYSLKTDVADSHVKFYRPPLAHDLTAIAQAATGRILRAGHICAGRISRASPTGSSYTLRHYTSTGIYLAVGDEDAMVYGTTDANISAIISLGKLADYTCDVSKNCAIVVPDINGNLKAAGVTAAKDVSLRAGDILQFQGLSALDTTIEVKSPTLSSAQLCQSPALPVGTAHPVPNQAPLPKGYLANNELSGP